MPSARLSRLRPINAFDVPPMSSGVCSETFSGRPFDVYAFRRVLPDQWRNLMRAHFTSAVHVAYVFSVDEKTARNWWDGIGSPRAEFALAAVKHIPGAAVHLGVAA